MPRISLFKGVASSLVFVLVIVVFIQANWVNNTQLKPAEGNAPSIFAKKILRYSFTLKNNTIQPIENVDFTVFLPAVHIPYQQLISLNISTDYTVLSDNAGNQLLKFHMDDFPAMGVKKINMALVLKKRVVGGSLVKATELDVKPYLRAEKYIELDNRALIEQAKAFQHLKPTEKVPAIQRWVRSTLEEIAYVKESRGAAYALKHKRGDCTEYMYLMIALLRLNEIPARPVGGFVVSDDIGLLKPGDFHNWLEYYQDGAWHIADPQGGVLNQNQEDYVVFQYLSEDNDLSQGYSQRFMKTDKRLVVRMNE